MRIAQVYDIPFAHNKATADFIVNSTLMDEEYDHDVINFKQNIKQRAFSRKLGVFSLRGRRAEAAVPWEDGTYVNLLDNRGVTIRGGKLPVGETPVILISPR